MRLRIALEELGPLFVGFGRYLASRIDLLPLVACSALAETRTGSEHESEHDSTPSLPDGFIEPAPFRRSLLHCWHRGVLDEEQSVIVKTVRKDVVEALEGQIEELPVLEKLRLDDLPEIGGAVEDYLVWLERQLDLRRDFRGLRRLAEESSNFDALFVPRLWEQRSDRQMLVVSDPGGTTIGDAVDAASGDDEDRDRARRLCSAWLQQVLLESVLPEGPIDENLCFLDDGRVAVIGGLFSSLGRKPRRHLLDALIATSRGDPDRACDQMLEACKADLEDSDRDRLQVLFRQAEPFRDGGWSDSYHGRRLADTLFVQWRLIRREGVEIPQPVVAFQRGLHMIDTSARRLAPGYDGFADAVDDLGIVAAASRLRETLSVRRVRGVVEAAVPVLRELGETAQKLGQEANGDSGEASPKATSEQPRWKEITGLLLLMVATVVSGQALRSAGIVGGWMPAAATGLFTVLAAITLWRIWRSGS
jgi:predicted unusual protein kinase regulating ubiquinone biosynthesis (AarF/ABC1/UbiB family)